MPAQRKERYSIELRTKSLYAVSLSDIPRKDLDQAPFVAGFGGQLCYVVCPGEVMADDVEAYNFKRPNLFQWVTMKMDMWVHLMILVE